MGGGYFYYTTTPEYALRELIGVIKQHDWKGFQNRVELEEMLGQAVDDFMDQQLNASKGSDEDTSSSSELGSLVSKGMMFLFKDPIKKSLKLEIKYFVMHGQFEDSTGSNISLASYWRTLDPPASYRKMQVLKREDPALVLFTFEPKQDTFVEVEVGMKKENGAWVVSEITNHKEVLKKLDLLRKSH